MSYKKEPKLELKQRVAQLEQYTGQVAMAMNDLRAQTHWILTVLQDVPGWKEALDKAQKVVENAKKMKENMVEEQPEDSGLKLD